MVSQISILFLLGTCTSIACAEPLTPSAPHILPTEIIIQKHKPDGENIIELSGQPGHLPFISNFLQKGTNLFFKPQFLIYPTIIPPPTLVDCKTSPLLPGLPVPPIPGQEIVDEPVRIVETTFPVVNNHVPHIEEIIDIRPMIVSHLPELPELVYPVEVVNDSVINFIPEAPVLPLLPAPLPVQVQGSDVDVNIPEHNAVVPEVNVILESIKPELSIIPEAPELPPLSIPELPFPVVIEESQASIVESHEVNQQSIIPILPDLPPLPFLPELPIPMIVSNQVRPIGVIECNEIKEVIPVPAVIPVLQEDVSIEEKPMKIPPLPVLPAKPLPVHTEESLLIPHAPELPPLSIVELPINVVVEAHHPVVEIQESNIEINPSGIPEAPVLPPLVPEPMPVLLEDPLALAPKMHPVFEILNPQRVSFIQNQIVMPTIPQTEVLSFPAACVQDIVMKRVLPNILHGKNIEVKHDVSILPVLFPHLFH